MLRSVGDQPVSAFADRMRTTFNPPQFADGAVFFDIYLPLRNHGGNTLLADSFFPAHTHLDVLLHIPEPPLLLPHLVNARAVAPTAPRRTYIHPRNPDSILPPPLDRFPPLRCAPPLGRRAVQSYQH